MSKISALAQGFERSAIEQQRSTDAAVQSALMQHESSLIEALNSSEQRTSDAIRASQKRTAAIARTGWWVLGIPLLTVLVLGGGWLWWLKSESDRGRATIAQQQRTIESLTLKGGGTRVTTCGDDPPRPCVKIDPDAPAWGASLEYRILAEEP